MSRIVSLRASLAVLLAELKYVAVNCTSKYPPVSLEDIYDHSGRPIPRILSALAGWDNHYSKRPTWSRTRATYGPVWPCSMRGLPCRVCCQTRGGLLPHPFTLTLAGGLFSVALSVQRGNLAPPSRLFKRRTALWSPEVPPQTQNRAGAVIWAVQIYCIKIKIRRTDPAVSVLV